MERLQDKFGVDIVILHLNAWQFLSPALKSEKDWDILFRVNSPRAAWRSLVDTYSLKTQGASLALLQKLDSVRIGTNDDPTLKLLEMEDIARSLRSSHSQWQHLTELMRGPTIGEGGDRTISSPGRSPKQRLPGTGLHDPLHGRQSCPEFIAFDEGVGQIYPR